MKVFISCDMEGISGITDPTYINPETGSNYQRGRAYMTHDVNAVIEGAIAAGATEILVADSHENLNNIHLEDLHPQARLLRGTPRDHSMMHGLDETYDAVFLIGYHTRHGVPGVLSHTMSRVIKNMYINGQVVGEFGFNAIYAGLYSVPVCLVSGDNLIAEEALGLIPDIQTAIVKYATSRTSAICLSLQESRAILQEQASLALQRCKEIVPLTTKLPLELKIEFSHYGQAEMAAIVPETVIIPNTTEVTYYAKNQSDMYKTMRAMMNLASSVPFC
ncbi:M55 family metallopeptidase [Brevibacillus sp. 7WMA2]|uniref:M55 family metallopeptidase n=1 Tax=Brevibacillus TaxID=55080 RepID=UPI0013A791CB|nr:MULTISPECIES: M55 family metallopeptidase [Brevibacillus]MCR8994165.1 M55 family metallopeptidase [Brevibacillus laterosporus]QIC07937.1 M55 family metallopeptidase [Brevibacillus sp. 7WMA2]WPS88994.1 M55 family metallopeptidase [Brevibacillus halotolerans]